MVQAAQWIRIPEVGEYNQELCCISFTCLFFSYSLLLIKECRERIDENSGTRETGAK